MRSILAAALLFCCAAPVQGAGNENPFKKARVGDWIAYEMTGPNMEGTTKMTIVAKDDNEVLYEVAGKFSFGGNEMVAPIQKQKIDLTKPHNPIVAANLKGKDVKFETEGEGKEKIKLGEKEFDTKWTKSKATTNVNGITVVTDYKMWFSQDVPLSGLVRMEMTTLKLTTKLELNASGSK